jgi:5'(3')-deoxyribonucleotidase
VPQLFLDMDGVLADFDASYIKLFGALPMRQVGQKDPPGMWEKIRANRWFYRELPLMPDAMVLWNSVEHLNPIVLTGVPAFQVPEAEAQKREWLAEKFGQEVRIICCKSQDKRLHGKPGDVLVDDWSKYRHLWEAMGGVFVLHTSARESVAQLKWLL